MKSWSLKAMIGDALVAQDGRLEAGARIVPRPESCIEEGFAYAAYCASRVEGVERVCFEEFLRRWPRDRTAGTGNRQEGRESAP